MAVSGIVLNLVDKTSGAVIGPTVLHALAALSPAPWHLQIRTAVDAGPDGTVNVAAYRQALQAIQDSGFDPPWMVIQEGLETGYEKLKGAAYLAAMPNAVLGYKGDPLLNPYLDRLADKVVAFITALGPQVPKYWFLWNESNLDSSTLRPGQIPQKPTSLAPEVFAAFLATLSTRITQAFPALGLVLIPGSLSCLEKFNTAADGPWVGGYVQLAMAYLNKNGVVAPYLFQHISLNLEGLLTDSYLAYTASALTRVMASCGLAGQTVIGECGEQNKDLTGADWSPSFRSLDKRFSYVFLYQFTTVDPTLYGLVTCGIDPTGLIYVRETLPFYTQVQAMLAAKNTPPVPPAPAVAKAAA